MKASTVINLKKERAAYFKHKSKSQVTVEEFPVYQYIAAVGESAERDVYRMHQVEYNQQSDALWSISRVMNRMKEISKERDDLRFKLLPLEVIWHYDQQQKIWRWQAQMMVPDYVDHILFEDALESLKQKKRSPKVEVKLIHDSPGYCLQSLHVGPYKAIDDTLKLMHDYAKEQHLTIAPGQRELYINQPFCNPPEKLQTIVRLAIKS